FSEDRCELMPDPIPFEEWRPDLSSRTNPGAEARGVMSVAGQYGPFPSLQDYGAQAQADAVVQGAAICYDSATVPHIFFGDASKLYHLESRVAEDRSISGGYSVGASDTWQFAQFGDNVIAVSRNVAPQVFNMTVQPVVAFDDLDRKSTRLNS